MAAKPTINTISCGSCGISNPPDMSFCLSCGKVLSARMAAIRKARGVKKRECTACKRSDELNNRYCIFCGAEIQKHQMSQSNAAALEKFTQEVSSVQDRRALLDKAEAAAARTPAVQTAAKPTSLLLAACTYVLCGIATALGVTMLSPIDLSQVMVALNSPIKDGLVLYTSEPFVDVILQSEDRKRFLLGSTGKNGSLAVGDLPAGNYLAKLSKLGHETVSQAVDVTKGRLNLLGFDSPIVLPKSFGDEGLPK